MPAPFRALGWRNYALYWTGALLSNIGSWMQTVALGWLVLQLTDSPFLVGFVSFAGLSPSLLLSLFGGVVADRMDRQRILIVTQAAMLVSTGILATLTAWGTVTVPQIIALSFITGLAGAMSVPAQQALISELVPAEVLPSAISLNAVQFNLARVVGPAVAGFVITWLGTAACFYINSVSFLALIIATMCLRVVPRRPLPASSFWGHLRAGVGYVRRHPLLLLILSTSTMVSVFALPFMVLMPVFARDVLQIGPTGLGYLLGAPGVGAVVGGVSLAGIGAVRDRARLALTAGASLSLAVVAFALSRDARLSYALLFVAGAGMTTCNATLNTLLQLTVEPNMRGRVLSMYALTLFGFAPLGSLQAGTLAHFIGTPSAVAVGGGISLLFMATALRRTRHLRAQAVITS